MDILHDPAVADGFLYPNPKAMTIPAQDDALFPTNMGLEYICFDHIYWYVGNAKQTASYYISHMGFRPIAYRGPETGSPFLSSYVIANVGGPTFIVTAPFCAPPRHDTARKEDQLIHKASDEDHAALAAIQEHLTTRGDGVKDVAFRITGDINTVWKRAIEHGACNFCVCHPHTTATCDSD